MWQCFLRPRAVLNTCIDWYIFPRCVNSNFETVIHLVNCAVAAHARMLDSSKAFDSVNLLPLYKNLHHRSMCPLFTYFFHGYYNIVDIIVNIVIINIITIIMKQHATIYSLRLMQTNNLDTLQILFIDKTTRDNRMEPCGNKEKERSSKEGNTLLYCPS